MNLYLMSAAGLAAIGVVWHGVGGERGIVSALDPSKLAPSFFGDGEISKRFLRACWHLFTVHLVAVAVLLGMLARQGPGPTTVVAARFVSLEFLGFLGVYLVVAIGRPALFARAPQWLFFGAIATLAWLGSTG